MYLVVRSRDDRYTYRWEVFGTFLDTSSYSRRSGPVRQRLSRRRVQIWHFDECNAFHFTSYLVAWPWLTHFLLRPAQLLVLCPLCPMCLHLDLVQSWASQGVPVLRTSTISMIQAGSRRRKCPWSYCPKVSLGLKGMQSLAPHECRLCIKFRPSVFISALPHHPLCVVVLPRPRKGLFDWSLCPRVSQCILSLLPQFSTALPSYGKHTRLPLENPRKRHSYSDRTESLRSSR